MDPKVTREIIQTSDSLRKKFQSLKRGLEETQEGRQRFFSPILQPLEDIKQVIEKKSSTQPLLDTPQKVKRPKKLIESFSWREDEDDDDVELQSAETQTPTIYRRSTMIPSTAETPAQTSPLISEPELEPEIKKEKEEFETEDPYVEQIREYVKTPQGEEELEQNLRTAGPLHREYLEALFEKGKKNLFDHRYGIRILSNGGLGLGDSTDIQLFVNSNDVAINGTVFEGTPGLLELLYLKNPQNYTEEDLKNYRNILVSTNAHRKGFSQERGIQGSRSIKYKNVISKLFTSQYLSPYRHRSSPTVGRLLRSHKRGMGMVHTMDANKAVYEFWNDVNELVDRLRLLIASSQAGHEGHENEIASIIEELREENIIY